MKALVLLNKEELENNDCKVIGNISKPMVVRMQDRDIEGWFRLDKPITQIKDEDDRPLTELYETEFTVIMEIPT